jgi:hypothetical protein
MGSGERPPAPRFQRCRPSRHSRHGDGHEKADSSRDVGPQEVFLASVAVLL